ncbi:hypothetical protein HYH03_004654 [Edaphochlamys debaryana]|uniref:Uncharacterized protein n=1 Tax=Edaphochlamys debaryana TaxID=47281 RepID=A0A836C358_9CHLO|nr:hypothetical protein HYH03_004654 [Edaphochlamys debaryana]|eukprot:KAG2497502.1 hypothetical protein HYH03_004654 [Edaphochlamys debaryana]
MEAFKKPRAAADADFAQAPVSPPWARRIGGIFKMDQAGAAAGAGPTPTRGGQAKRRAVAPAGAATTTAVITAPAAGGPAGIATALPNVTTAAAAAATGAAAGPSTAAAASDLPAMLQLRRDVARAHAAAAAELAATADKTCLWVLKPCCPSGLISCAAEELRTLSTTAHHASAAAAAAAAASAAAVTALPPAETAALASLLEDTQRAAAAAAAAADAVAADAAASAAAVAGALHSVEHRLLVLGPQELLRRAKHALPPATAAALRPVVENTKRAADAAAASAAAVQATVVAVRTELCGRVPAAAIAAAPQPLQGGGGEVEMGMVEAAGGEGGQEPPSAEGGPSAEAAELWEPEAEGQGAGEADGEAKGDPGDDGGGGFDLLGEGTSPTLSTRFKVGQRTVAVFVARTREDVNAAERLLVDPCLNMAAALLSVAAGEASMEEAVGPAVGCLVASFGTNMIASGIYRFEDPEALRLAGGGAEGNTIAWSSEDRLAMSIGLMHGTSNHDFENGIRCGFCVAPPHLVKQVNTELELMCPQTHDDYEYYRGCTVAWFKVAEVKAGLQRVLNLVR